MQVDLVEESPPATPMAQIEQGPDFMRPEPSLYPGHLSFSSHWYNRLDSTSALSSFVQSLPGHWNRRVYELEAWNDTSPVSTVYLRSESICHQLIGSVVARLCQARKALWATDLHSLLPKKKPGVRGVNPGKSLDQKPGFHLSKNCSCVIVLHQWKSCTKLTVFTNDHNT